ncbi:putative mitochondrial carrier protein [Trypanosoma rangeli]|uniref:Putative mitochondrial carrier protein n=1 Tax=Trypanosoma rangeli TaxID=5698 RepID=A0A3R7KWT0_TRYRA|nr:putative mitochondrial carrier protein [Trypanosoma rangeli]RNF11240.1 putative mitochondrial carrier protein [Trypanosoma rangeli]|eukprot:RNF11240.1 putative mitochondrial carrier protein [Trypanosoma rangeli]
MSSEKKIQKNAPLPLPWTVGIAGFSGMLGWVFTHPFEMWKNTVMMAPAGTSQMECLRQVQERGAFKGLSAGLLRQVVYAPARLGCYPIFRDAIMSVKGAGSDASPTVADRAIAGAVSGAFASFLSSPVEVCLVLQTTSPTKLSINGAAAQVYGANGIAGYWRGIGALASRAALVGVCQVAVHDQVLTFLRRQNKQQAERKRVTPYSDNIVVNAASICTALFYAFCTMPVEMARVRMSSEARKGKTPEGQVAKVKYTNVVQAISRIAREEGVLAMYDSFVPYFCRCATHTVACFFVIEYLTRNVKAWRASE